MIQALREFAAIIKHHPPPDETAPRVPGEKVEEFLALLNSGRAYTEEEIAQHFYQKDKNSSSYQYLRGRLIDEMVERMLEQPDPPKPLTDRQQALFKCSREWTAVKMIIEYGGRTSAMQLGKRVLRQARRFDLTDLVVDITRFLRLYYGLFKRDHVRFNKYNNLLKEQAEVLRWEDAAEEAYIELAMYYFSGKISATTLQDLARERYEQLRPALASYDSFRLHLSGSLIEVMMHAGAHDEQNIIAACQRIIRFFENKPYNTQTPLQLFYLQLLSSYTKLRQYEAGEHAAQRCLALSLEGTFNWFRFQEHYFILCMHTERYQQAWQLFLRISQHPKLRQISDIPQEKWRIFGAYLYYLHRLGLFDAGPAPPNEFRFRLGKFLNNVPHYTRDKRGMNVPILIIQVLIMLLRHRYSDLLDRLEAVEKYASRHLTQDENPRSSCFIKMLAQLPPGNFHAENVERRAKKHYDRLLEHPLDATAVSRDLEIIPYDRLWEIVLHNLRQNQHEASSQKNFG